MSINSDAPIIGLTQELLDAPWYQGPRRYQLFTAYTECIRTAGGIPIIIPADSSRKELDALLNKVDGVLMTGGDDADLRLLGGPAPDQSCKPMPPEQQNMNMMVVERVIQRQLPCLGICLGMQMMGIFHGAGFIQNLDNAEQHIKGIVHTIHAQANTLLADIIGQNEVDIQSFHHQALATSSEPLVIAAKDEYGLIEAIENPQLDFFLGLQWHPEKTPDSTATKAIFSRFIEAARDYRISA